KPTDAYSIVSTVSGYRGVLAVRGIGGRALALEDARLVAAQRELARAGLWTELSAAAGLAGLRAVGDVEGPVVCVSTSSGFKDLGVGSRPTAPVAPEWDEVERRLAAAGIRG
ncbi:threonine synthase, partial [Kitasatospora sp. NPDC093558]